MMSNRSPTETIPHKNLNSGGSSFEEDKKVEQRIKKKIQETCWP
jgi:hypothetical protein